MCAEDFAHAERGGIAGHLRFLVRELQDPDVAEELPVEVVVESQWPNARHAHEALTVERHAPPPGERSDRLEGELAPWEGGDVHPPPRRQLREIGRLPDVAQPV